MTRSMSIHTVALAFLLLLSGCSESGSGGNPMRPHTALLADVNGLTVEEYSTGSALDVLVHTSLPCGYRPAFTWRWEDPLHTQARIESDLEHFGACPDGASLLVPEPRTDILHLDGVPPWSIRIVIESGIGELSLQVPRGQANLPASTTHRFELWDYARRTPVSGAAVSLRSANQPDSIVFGSAVSDGSGTAVIEPPCGSTATDYDVRVGPEGIADEFLIGPIHAQCGRHLRTLFALRGPDKPMLP